MTRIADILTAFQAFPEADIQTVLAGRRPLILAPHPDDESLGCGGMIAAACAAGLTPVVVILTDGSASHPGSSEYPPQRLGRLREAEALRAVQLLGMPGDHLYFLRFEDSCLPFGGNLFNAAVMQISQLAARHDCRLIIGPWAGDPHCDHEAAAAMAAACARHCGHLLLSYPVWGWLRDETEIFDEPLGTGWRLNISAQLHTKQQAIAAHESQYGDLITDAPEGFKLPRDLLDIFARPYEIFIAGLALA